MSHGLGARLRHCREQRGVALQAIAHQTKIKASLLEGLERDDVSLWPRGLYRRAYFRSYAEAIGLDAAEALREFLAVHPDPVGTAAGPALGTTCDEVSVSASAAPPTRIGMMLTQLMRSMRPGGRRRTTPPPGLPLPSAPGSDGSPAEAASESVTARTWDMPDMPSSAVAEVASERAGAVTAVAAEDVSEPALAEVAAVPEPFGCDLEAVARLCTAFGSLDDTDDPQPLLQQAGILIGASGLIVWTWDGAAGHLQPAQTFGYSRRLLTQLSPVRPDDHNPTASAFRSASVVAVSDDVQGALVVPLIAPEGCLGVLAIELPCGRERLESVQNVATIVASLLVLRARASAPAPSPAMGRSVLPQSRRPPVRRRRASAASLR